MRTSPISPPTRQSDDPGPSGALLVVIGGLPGSGKTTLLRRLLSPAPAGVTGLDSEQIAARLREAGVRLPYPMLRPAVHGWHRWRVLRQVMRPETVLVLTDPWTSPRWRAAVLWAARRARRPVRVVLLDVPRDLADSGLRARGRAVSPRAMDRHTARWNRLRRTLAAGKGLRGVDEVLVVNRPLAARLSPAQILAATVRPAGSYGPARSPALDATIT